jgi:hypothetical protein
LDFVFDTALKVVVVNDDVMDLHILVDDCNRQPKHVMIELDEEIRMLMIDDVSQRMPVQRLVEVLMDLLDDDFLLSKLFE